MIFIAVVLLVAVNAIFVAVEFALIASRPLRLQEAAKNGKRSSLRALAAHKDLRRQVSGAQLGITASSVILGITAEPSIGRLIQPVVELFGASENLAESISWITAIGFAGIVQLLLGEMVPKNLAVTAPEITLQRLISIHRVFVLSMSPLIWILDKLSTILVKPFGYTPVDEINHALGVSELSAIFDSSHQKGSIDEFEHELLTSALDLGIRPVEEISIPRQEIVAVTKKMTIAEIEEQILKSGHTRMPVIGENLDDIVGMVHAKDLLQYGPEMQSLILPEDSIRELVIVSPDMTQEDALLLMRRNRNHLVVLQNPVSETVGLITMEDVVEELVGEFEDETDVEFL